MSISAPKPVPKPEKLLELPPWLYGEILTAKQRAEREVQDVLDALDEGVPADLEKAQQKLQNLQDLWAKAGETARKAQKAYEDQRVDVAEVEEYAKEKARRRARRRADEDEAEDDEAASSWDGIDLSPFLDGSLPEVEPTALLRTDGKGMFYSGYNTLFGDSTAGKSLICAEAVRQQIVAGNVVLWVEFEEPNAGVISARLLSMGLSGPQIKSRLHFVRPASGTSRASLRRAAAGALKLCGEEGADGVGLVVVDSVGESLALEGLSMDKDSDVGPWATRVKLFVQEFPRAAVVVIDHGKKGNDDHSKYFPSGTFRKIATVTGAAWLAETVEPFSKDHAGSVRLLCAKDRHGGYRRKDVGAVIHVTPQALAGPDGHLVVDVRPPGPGGAASADDLWPLVTVAVQVCKKSADLLTTNDMTKALGETLAKHNVKASTERKRAAVDLAVQLGALSRTKQGQSYLHAFVRELTHDDSQTVAEAA